MYMVVIVSKSSSSSVLLTFHHHNICFLLKESSKLTINLMYLFYLIKSALLIDFLFKLYQHSVLIILLSEQNYNNIV